MATFAPPTLEESTQDQAPPETQEQDFGENFEDLPEEKVAELRQVILALNNRDQWARMVEIIRCTLRRYFWLGIQHGFWNADTQQFQVGPAGGTYTSGGENLNEEDLFSEDFNIYTQNGKIFMSVFAQNADSSRMEPDKPLDTQSVAAAEEAEKYIRVYQKYNPPKSSQLAVGKLLWTDGRVVAWTDHSPNGDIFGYDTDDSGKRVARSGQWTRYFGVLETKVPIVENEFSKWAGMKISIDRDIFTAKEDNPDFAKDLKKGKSANANDEVARMSRVSTSENISQVSSDTVANLITEDVWFLRPAAFRALEDEKRAFWTGSQGQPEDDDEDPVDATPGIFPNGCRVKFFGDVYCGAKAVSMDDEIKVMHALPGNGNSRPSLSDPVIPIQMEFNDGMNMFSQMLHKCIPVTHVRGSVDDIAAITENAANYGNYVPFDDDAAPGVPVSDSFFPEPQVTMPDGFDKWMENLQGPLMQFVTGNSPALFGQQMEDQKTAHGYAQARDMSLGLLSIVWTPYGEFASGIRGQAARKAMALDEPIAAFMQGEGGAQDETLSVDPMILRGGFTCSPVTDQSFPESWTETSNTWKGLKAASVQDPDLAADFQLPDNQKGFQNAIGLKDFKTRGSDGRDMQLEEWLQMQQDGGPLPDIEATQQRDQQQQAQVKQAVQTLAPGKDMSALPPLPQQPPIMRSTVPINPDTDDHPAHYQALLEQLNNSEGRKLKKSNPDAWENGRIHLLAHKTYMMQNNIAVPLQSGQSVPPPMPPKPGMPPPASPLLGGGAAPPPGAPPAAPAI